MNTLQFSLKQALLAAPIVADHEPWQGLVRAWVKSNGASIYAIGVPILRQWMQGHPGDATTAERLARWEQQLNERERAA